MDWIYTKDGVPDISEVYLVSWAGKFGEKMFTGVEIIEWTEKREWDIEKLEKTGYTACRVIAWMPLPPPCEEETR